MPPPPNTHTHTHAYTTPTIQIDFICISYCRSGVDVREVRAFAESVPALAACGLVAKVETRQALFNFRVSRVCTRVEGREGEGGMRGRGLRRGKGHMPEPNEHVPRVREGWMGR